MKRLDRYRFLNCRLAFIVTAFRTDPMVLHRRITIRAGCHCWRCRFVVCSSLIPSGFRYFTFRMCHRKLYLLMLFVPHRMTFGGYLFWKTATKLVINTQITDFWGKGIWVFAIALLSTHPTSGHPLQIVWQHWARWACQQPPDYIYLQDAPFFEVRGGG